MTDRPHHIDCFCYACEEWDRTMARAAKEKADDRLARMDCSESFVPAPESLWLVIVECRYNVVSVCASGRGFYIPGQEPCWEFSHVSEWIAEIDPANYQSSTKTSAVSSLPNTIIRIVAPDQVSVSED